LPSQSQADCVNAAAAVAQSAIQQLQAAKEIKKQVRLQIMFILLCRYHFGILRIIDSLVI
jgi:hypothetical protein